MFKDAFLEAPWLFPVVLPEGANASTEHQVPVSNPSFLTGSQKLKSNNVLVRELCAHENTEHQMESKRNVE